MRILIVEDDLATRKYLFKLLSDYGQCDLVVDGLEAIDAYLLAFKEKRPYDLISLDIMIPKVDGIKALKAIRDLETQKGLLPSRRVKVIITTALAETQLVQDAFEIGCQAYLSKPIDAAKLREVLINSNLIPQSE